MPTDQSYLYSLLKKARTQLTQELAEKIVALVAINPVALEECVKIYGEWCNEIHKKCLALHKPKPTPTTKPTE